MNVKRIALWVLVILIAAAGGAVLYAIVTSNGRDTTKVTPAPSAVSPSPNVTPAPTVVATTACKAAQLTVSVAPDNSAAGTAYYLLELTNQSQTKCTVYGYPGVSLIDAAGQQIGPAAVRNASRALATITLAPGDSAHSSVGFPNPGNFDGGKCTAQSVNIKVYPPDETHALTAPLVQQACAGFSVSPLAAGTKD